MNNRAIPIGIAIKEVKGWFDENRTSDFKLSAVDGRSISIILSHGNVDHTICIEYPRNYPESKTGYKITDTHTTKFQFIESIHTQCTKKSVSIRKILTHMFTLFCKYKSKNLNASLPLTKNILPKSTPSEIKKTSSKETISSPQRNIVFVASTVAEPSEWLNGAVKINKLIDHISPDDVVYDDVVSRKSCNIFNEPSPSQIKSMNAILLKMDGLSPNEMIDLEVPTKVVPEEIVFSDVVETVQESASKTVEESITNIVEKSMIENVVEEFVQESTTKTVEESVQYSETEIVEELVTDVAEVAEESGTKVVDGCIAQVTTERVIKVVTDSTVEDTSETIADTVTAQVCESQDMPKVASDFSDTDVTELDERIRDQILRFTSCPSEPKSGGPNSRTSEPVINQEPPEDLYAATIFASDARKPDAMDLIDSILEKINFASSVLEENTGQTEIQSVCEDITVQHAMSNVENVSSNIDATQVIENVTLKIDDVILVIEDAMQTLEDVTPVIEDVTPIIEDATPMPEDVTPVIEDVTLVIEDVTPVIENVTPIIEDATPMPEDVTPVIENVTPVIEDVTPVIENVTPIIENVTPIIENVTPVIEDVTPVIEDVTPNVQEATLIKTDFTNECIPYDPKKEISSDDSNYAQESDSETEHVESDDVEIKSVYAYDNTNQKNRALRIPQIKEDRSKIVNCDITKKIPTDYDWEDCYGLNLLPHTPPFFPFDMNKVMCTSRQKYITKSELAMNIILNELKIIYQSNKYKDITIVPINGVLFDLQLTFKGNVIANIYLNNMKYPFEAPTIETSLSLDVMTKWEPLFGIRDIIDEIVRKLENC